MALSGFHSPHVDREPCAALAGARPPPATAAPPSGFALRPVTPVHLARSRAAHSFLDRPPADPSQSGHAAASRGAALALSLEQVWGMSSDEPPTPAKGKADCGILMEIETCRTESERRGWSRGFHSVRR